MTGGRYFRATARILPWVGGFEPPTVSRQFPSAATAR